MFVETFLAVPFASVAVTVNAVLQVFVFPNDGPEKTSFVAALEKVTDPLSAPKLAGDVMVTVFD